MDNQHSKLGPSGAERWLNCTKSVQMQELALKEDPSLADQRSIYADTGTIAHLVGEVCLEYKTTADKVLENMANEVNKYLEYVRAYQTETSYLHIEVKLKLTKLVWGTADVVLYDEATKHLHIMDLKYGRKKVKAEKNKQLMIYALAAMKTFKQYKVNRVTVHICQPRINHFDTYEPSLKELKELKKLVKTKEKEVFSDKATLVYSPQHCFFCAAKYICSEYNEKTSGFVDITI